MKTKAIIIQFIEHLSNYEAESEKHGIDLNFSDFLGYLNSNQAAVNIKTKQLQGDVKTPELIENDGSETDISILIVLLFRYAKGYIIKALKDSKINSADEFSFLITLLTHESLSKTELIQKQVMEKTSGTEIINRLCKLGLINQLHDAVDKRSVRVSISQEGRVELFKVLPHMQKVSQLVAGNLNTDEKTTLAYMLRKLEHFHNDIFLNQKEVPLHELVYS
ncbi:MAG: hypothetical protein AUK44_08165 [Porphyromonadaceae bacterium CG2_30_38_12]|nr:MAG: hypothetical protein AUK44_08165 [Porphyromonadaceae bacterium CG2_30_38_12]